ncbi:hypothetical protein A7K91_15130 [Paenibacillus oryzae]|uniref:Uncharacterized protein n=1 Tax=Paenibacillus oryzae TaxID=1844972 RepID=A0A1A5YTK4_9BACL|nr:hypothetical protein A7K91_15130 [Paenibacillus oryzae]
MTVKAYIHPQNATFERLKDVGDRYAKPMYPFGALAVIGDRQEGMRQISKSTTIQRILMAKHKQSTPFCPNDGKKRVLCK